MDIVDAQVHANRISPTWTTSDYSGAADAAVATMNAVGVDAVLHDEYSGVSADGRVLPGALDQDGTWVSANPFAEAAARRYPDRFAYVTHVDEYDPALERRVAAIGSTPGCLGIRVAKPRSQVVVDRVEAGDFDRLFAAAAEHRVPVFITMPQKPAALGPALTKYAGLAIVLDHCGVVFPADTLSGPERDACLDPVLAMAGYENLHIKWCHIERLSADGFPFADGVRQLRRVVRAFGVARVMWGSDWTESIDPNRSSKPSTWPQTLHYLLDSEEFTSAEKEWLLGRSLRTLLRWPQPSGDSPSAPENVNSGQPLPIADAQEAGN
ncbi:amidohydrolase family protein [Streptomyces sp. NPDC057137]|uniref:amidohydrolase family protein n=1 Tax=Streptomyces sp. NPDC057137 TaxID=3346030 RepID=UPI0036423016